MYYQDTQDLLAGPSMVPLLPTPSGFAAYAHDAGSSNAAGGELGLESRAATGLRWSINHAYIAIQDHLSFPTLTGPAQFLNYRDGSPRNVINAGLGYSTGPWELDLQGHWQSRFTDYIANGFAEVEPFKTDSRLIFNARIGYRVAEHLTLSIAGAQLANTRVFEAAGAPVDRRISASVTASF
jgi:outer membrane receptor for ferrienterochelin and colicins